MIEEDESEDDVNIHKDLADFSDEEESDNEENRNLNKQALLEWLTVVDFTKEVQLQKISQHKFKLDREEESAMIDQEGILKICKV